MRWAVPGCFGDVLSAPGLSPSQEASDVKPSSNESAAESYRAALDKAWRDYVKEHFPDGSSSVSTSPFFLFLFLFFLSDRRRSGGVKCCVAYLS